MNNKLTDLNNHLFMALERLNDEEISGEKLDSEIKRSKAVTAVAKSITENAAIMLEAKKHFDEMGIRMADKDEVPDMLRISAGRVSDGKTKK